MSIHTIHRIHHFNRPRIHCIILLLLIPSRRRPNYQCRSFCIPAAVSSPLRPHPSTIFKLTCISTSADSPTPRNGLISCTEDHCVDWSWPPPWLPSWLPIRMTLVANEGNPGNRAAPAYIGTSAATERGMVTWIMRLYEGYGDLYIPRISGS